MPKNKVDPHTNQTHIRQENERKYDTGNRENINAGSFRVKDFFHSQLTQIIDFADRIIVSNYRNVIPTAVLVLSMGLTGQIGKMEYENGLQDERLILDEQITEIITHVQKRVLEYDLLLSGVRSFFNASGGITEEGFHSYIQGLGINKRLPETHGTSVSLMKRENNSIELAPVIFMEPPNENVIKMNNFEFPAKKIAMEEAQNSGKSILTDPLFLRQKPDKEDGFLMFHPFYKNGFSYETVAERNANIYGWIATAFSVSDLMFQVFSNQYYSFHLSIIDESIIDESKTIFQSNSEAMRMSDQPSVSKKVLIANREWKFILSFMEGARQNKYHDHFQRIIITGAMMSILLTFFIYFLVQRRADSFIILKKINEVAEKLKKSEARYRKIFNDSGVAMFITDPITERIIDANKRACEYYGYSLEQFRGMLFTDISAISTEEIGKRLESVMLKGQEQFDSEHHLASGERRSVKTSVSIIELEGKMTVLSVVEDITTRKKAVEEILYMANHDALTGLPNRNLFLERFKIAISHANRSGKSIALMFVDLDNFKYVNDTLGHSIGDELLKQVADRMRNCIRNEDMVARQGGDEFLVLLPDISSSDNASIVATKLNESLAQSFEIEGHILHISASIGIALYPENGNVIDELMKYGDEAMYRIKAEGKNGCQFFSPEMHAHSSRRQEIISHLHNALSSDEISTHFQRVVDVKTGKIISFEALMRWNSAELGSIPPSEFIPLAEESGLITSLENWIIRDVCRKIKSWESQGIHVPRIAINLSIRHFQSKTLIKDIMNTLDEYGVSPKNLSLEITEDMLINDMTDASEKIKSLSELGFEILLDDFGTGYSNLGYLQDLHFDKLKIDKVFVDHMDNARTVSVIGLIIAIAHTFGSTVIAEGVETLEQANKLRDMGCDAIQGYFYGRPEDVEKTTFLLQAQKVEK